MFHYTPEEEVTAIDTDSGTSELVDIGRLEVEDLPAIIFEGNRQESEVG